MGGVRLRTPGLLAASFAAALGTVAVFQDADATNPAPPGAAPVDLITGFRWDSLDGATVSGSLLTIHPIGRQIVSLDAGEPPANNPPINLRGLSLRLRGDFRLSVTMRALNDSGAFLTIYGSLPIIYDESRQEGKTLYLGIERGCAVLKLWDGTGGAPGTYRFGSGLSGAVELELVRKEGRFVIGINGKDAGEVKDPGLFDAGQAWLGADVAMGNQLTLSGLSLNGIGDRAAESQAVVPPGLAAVAPSDASVRALAAKHGLLIGAAVASIPLLTDAPYRNLLGREFSMVTPENVMKFQFIHPQRDVYAFADADAIVDFARANKMAVHGHTLAWQEAVPAWVAREGTSPAALREIIHDHIATVVGHFKGRVQEWDVLNEPLNDDGAFRNTIWKKALGKDYPDALFRWAHEADPGAKLYVNEYDIEEGGEKAGALAAIMSGMRQRGVPVDGVGLQMHEDIARDADTPTPEGVAANMARFERAGFLVRISEMDVNIHGRVTPAKLAAQAGLFAAMLGDCLRAKNCTAFSMWGFTDRYSSLADTDRYNVFGNGLIFDSAFAPKPAYSAMAEALK